MLQAYNGDQHDGLAEISITSLPNQPDHLYVLASNRTSIKVFSLTAPGQAQRIQKLEVGGPAAKAGVSLRPIYASGMATWLKQR
ncbi:hypothetical protein AX17_006053 [Amanita inopinata Kibby_2008]|nr:hypothetical protein AX17_006053 [Amanita inopinata Kibby_2008]